MLGVLLFSMALVTDCADFLRELPEPSRDRRMTPSELASVFRMPSKIDGLVAILMQSKNLRVYGVANLERTGFQKIEIWGFEKFPQLLLVLDSEGNIQKIAEDEMIVTALVETPRLEKLLISKQVIPEVARELKWKLKVRAFEKLDQDIAAAEHIPIWGEIYRILHENRLIDDRVSPSQKSQSIFHRASKENPSAHEIKNIDFGGWLSPEHNALAIIQQRQAGDGVSAKVYLHPQFKAKLDPAFPDLAHRITLENRFDIRWIQNEKIVVIETEPEIAREGISFGDNMILIFKEGENLPQGIPYFRLDPETGARLTGRQFVRRSPLR